MISNSRVFISGQNFPLHTNGLEGESLRPTKFHEISIPPNLMKIGTMRFSVMLNMNLELVLSFYNIYISHFVARKFHQN